MKRYAVVFLIVLMLVPHTAFSGGAAESAASSTRSLYLAERGKITPPEEIYTDSYIAAVDYVYPDPEKEAGFFLYPASYQVPAEGGETLLHIGIQGKKSGFADLPPMNLVFVVDLSSSMGDEEKIQWVKDSFKIFINKLRDADFLSLVVFSDEARTLFPSSRISGAKKEELINLVENLSPQGGSNLEAGLEKGYQQALMNFRENYINRLLFLSDGTEFSSRLNREKAQSGDVRVSLIWDNFNDLDLHVETPEGNHIYYGNSSDANGGFLDVDANGGGPSTPKPVENIFWPKGKAPGGEYRVYVRNFNYHDRDVTGPYSFRVEVKNGLEISRFSGEIEGTGETSDVEVARFRFKTGVETNREKALIYEMAENYKTMGIHLSTIGVGVGFDLELMQTLAREGGGSSRFISNREEMRKIFDTEFVRMAVPAAKDLKMELTFGEGVDILGTWGYNHQVLSDRVLYSLPTLHNGDYETILIRYRLPPRAPGEFEAAGFQIRYTDLSGEEQILPRKSVILRAVAGGEALSPVSNGIVLQSGAMQNFASVMEEVGTRFYAVMDQMSGPDIYDEDGEFTQDLTDQITSKITQALSLVQGCKDSLENIRHRLDQEDLFADQLTILDRYNKTLNEFLMKNGFTESSVVKRSPTHSDAAPGDLHERLVIMVDELILAYQDEPEAVTALSGFARRDGEESSLAALVNETSLLRFANQGLRVVERERLDAVMEEQKFSLSALTDTENAIQVGKLLSVQRIITGTILPLGGRTVVFGRVIDVESGEILTAAQVILTEELLGGLL